MKPYIKPSCPVLRQSAQCQSRDKTTTYVHDLFLDVDNANNEYKDTARNNSPVHDKPTCADKQDQHNKSASDLFESSA